jgi:hypothetical protein
MKLINLCAEFVAIVEISQNPPRRDGPSMWHRVHAKQHLKQHPEYAWQSSLLED